MKPITFGEGLETQVRTEADIRLIHSYHADVMAMLDRINELERQAEAAATGASGFRKCASCKWMHDPGGPMRGPVCVRYPPSIVNPGERMFPFVIPHVHFCGEWEQR